MQENNSTRHSEGLKNDFVYNIVSTISNFMDKRFLDPLLGFIFPAFGDTLMSVLALPYLYLSVFRIKSLPLSLAIILNTLIDIMVGIIPYGIGDVLDIFHRSYAKNLKLIDGFVGNDEKVIREVNRKAWITGLLIIVSGAIIFLFMKLAMTLITGGFRMITGLFA